MATFLDLNFEEVLFILCEQVSGDYFCFKTRAQSWKLKTRYGARNRFQEPSLELSSQAT
jgi:hypothetical protein